MLSFVQGKPPSSLEVNGCHYTAIERWKFITLHAKSNNFFQFQLNTCYFKRSFLNTGAPKMILCNSHTFTAQKFTINNFMEQSPSINYKIISYYYRKWVQPKKVKTLERK
jgi:hypothetical protein